jgi:hypothetical protein
LKIEGDGDIGFDGDNVGGRSGVKVLGVLGGADGGASLSHLSGAVVEIRMLLVWELSYFALETDPEAIHLCIWQ